MNLIQVSNIFLQPSLCQTTTSSQSVIIFPVNIRYDPVKPNRHFPFFITDFTDDPDKDGQLHDGYMICMDRVDPAQLENEMFAAWVEENREDAVIIRVPYMSFGHQMASEERKDRAAFLESKGKIVHRARHELGFHLHTEEILASGNPKEASDGFRSTYFRITFPPGTHLTAAAYGTDGELNLNAIAYKSTEGVKELYFDIQWHVSLVEDKPRFKDKKKMKKASYLDDACEGMAQGMASMEIGSS